MTQTELKLMQAHQMLGYHEGTIEEIKKVILSLSEDPNTPKWHRQGYKAILGQIKRCQSYQPKLKNPEHFCATRTRRNAGDGQKD